MLRIAPLNNGNSDSSTFPIISACTNFPLCSFLHNSSTLGIPISLSSFTPSLPSNCPSHHPISDTFFIVSFSSSSHPLRPTLSLTLANPPPTLISFLVTIRTQPENTPVSLLRVCRMKYSISINVFIDMTITRTRRGVNRPFTLLEAGRGRFRSV